MILLCSAKPDAETIRNPYNIAVWRPKLQVGGLDGPPLQTGRTGCHLPAGHLMSRHTAVLVHGVSSSGGDGLFNLEPDRSYPSTR